MYMYIYIYIYGATFNSIFVPTIDSVQVRGSRHGDPAGITGGISSAPLR